MEIREYHISNVVNKLKKPKFVSIVVFILIFHYLSRAFQLFPFLKMDSATVSKWYQNLDAQSITFVEFRVSSSEKALYNNMK